MSETYEMSLSAMIERLQAQSAEIAALTAMVAERDQRLEVEYEQAKDREIEYHSLRRAKDDAVAELERVRSGRDRLLSAASDVVSNWDIFEIQDKTARAVFGHSIGLLRSALASPAAEPVSRVVAESDLRDLQHLATRIEMDGMPVGDLGSQCCHSLPALKRVIGLLQAQPAPVAQSEPKATRQYYYKNDSCPAWDSNDPDCICWHDEGTGPLPDGGKLLDGSTLVELDWRDKPVAQSQEGE